MSFLKPSKLLVQSIRLFNFNHVLKTNERSLLRKQIANHFSCKALSLSKNFFKPELTSSISKPFSSHAISNAPSKTDKVMSIENASSGVSNDSAKEPLESMTWDQYFQHKKMRRLRDRVLSLPAAFVSCSFTGSYLMTNVVLDASDNGLIFGLDPFIVFGLASASSGLVAFLVTPLIGSLIFRLLKPKVYQEMILKDADFYQRIAKYRVNMSVQPRSVSAPPDFYGEKILSRKDYRHWLRRQFDYKRQMAF